MKRILTSTLIMMVFSFCANAQENDDRQYTEGLLKPGELAPDFIIANGDTLAGKPLSSFRGRYVVLDFWASWCRDCRKDIPAVKALHKKYASDDIVFIGVSFDTDKETWMKCVRDNGMNWIHHSELKPWKSTGISADYHIKWIPTMYLLDKEGRILFSTIHAEEMERAVMRVLERD